MTITLNIAELDCIFISYDEPNAEKHWADLLNKCMWAKRSHGVKGSDACHKAAANLSETDWFITVDADNIVNSTFFAQTIEVPDNTQALSWPGVNAINGLHYGNGSLKLWHKDFVLGMQTHELSDTDKREVDFCWEKGYRPMIDSYSTSYPNASPYQAWRAGFREGVKMSLVDGVCVVNPAPDKLHWHNLHRLKIWMSTGAHAENGLWAILGARYGCYKINCTDWDYTEVRDFDKLENIWNEISDPDVMKNIIKYGDLVQDKYGIKSTLLAPDTSLFVVDMFKEQYQQAKEQIEWINRRNCV
jgi:hypothetical protein